MKKNYETPECVVESLMTEDVITASGKIGVTPGGWVEGFFPQQ